ncbi:MAG TPA: hypothetical protein VMG59_09950 [Phycisphaerae bacterium]|nr:hypothetical protein [Phycisphaerae bacterium]
MLNIADNKYELIEAIVKLNRSARVDFLEKFNEDQLRAYLNRISQYKPICYLQQAVLPRNPSRYSWY